MTAASPSSATDWLPLIGVPWRAGAQGPDAYDCWAFASMVQSRFFQRPLVPIADFGSREAARNLVAARRTWRRVEVPTHGDMVEFQRFGRADHVGVWLDVDRGGVLHCMQGPGTCFDRVADLEVLGWRPRFWTPGRATAEPIGAQVAGLYISSIGPLLNQGAIEGSVDDILAAHRGIPLDVRAGETIADVLGRAAIDPARVMCFLRPRGAPASPIEATDEAALRKALDDMGRVDPAHFPTTRIGGDDVLLVVSVPRGGGGGGSDPLRIILSIVVVIAAVVLAYFGGPVLAGAFFGAGATAAQVGAVTAAVFAVGSLAGNLLVNALLPPPSPDNQRQGLISDASPTYSAQAQAAVARPGAVIPECLGRHIHAVDDASPPWARYEDNVQFLQQLLCLGTGDHEIHEVRLGQTCVWLDGALTDNLPGIEIEFIEPEGQVTLFEDAVYTQPDVTGQTIEPDVTLAWQPATPEGIEAATYEVDVGFGQLVRFVNGDVETTVELLIEAQRIDADGNPTADSFPLETLTFTEASRSAVRSSHRYQLPNGRWQFRVSRLTPEGDQNTFDTAQWIGLKALLPAGRTYGNVHLMALRAEVGTQLASQTARRVQVIKTRKVPELEDGAWTEPRASRKISAAIGHICRLHGREADLDLAELASLEATWTQRGDTCDVVVDQELSLWEALQGVCRTGRAQPDQIGRRIRIWRDEPRELPTMLFTGRNIIRGSLVQRPTLAVSTRPERLVVPFLNEETWNLDQVEVGPSDRRERQERYFGIANRAQLTREIRHDWRAARFRPGVIAWDAELEGRLIRRGDPVAVAHRQFVSSNPVAIVAWSGNRVTLDEPVDLADLEPDPEFAVASPSGTGVWGPVPITGVVDAEQTVEIILDDAAMAEAIADAGDPVDWIASAGDRDERLRGVVGPSEQLWRRVIVESVGAEREGRSTIVGLIDDPRAHEGDAPITATGIPEIATFTAERGESETGDFVAAKVTLVPGEDSNTIVFEYSIDNRTTWVPAMETEALETTFEIPDATTDVRAAPVGTYRGTWVVVDIDDTKLLSPDDPVEPAAGRYAETADITVAASVVVGAVSYEFRLYPDGALEPTETRYSTQPSLSLSVDQLGPLGGPWRSVLIKLYAVLEDASLVGPGSITLTNPAPAAPTGLAFLFGRLDWDAGEADVLNWVVDIDGQDPVTVTSPTLFIGDEEPEYTGTVTAYDVVGPGAPTPFSYTT